MTNTNTVVSLRERRKHPRVSDAVALRLNAADTSGSNFTLPPLDPAPTHIVRIGCGGLRFTHSTSLEANTLLLISIHLASINKTVHIDSRVVSSGEANTTNSNKAKAYFVQIEFQKIDEKVKEMLQTHINHVLAKTSPASSRYSYIA